jgi:tagatose-1,6-bisphosphate aldolase non-catalytic subunit AgaZ/GatZ
MTPYEFALQHTAVEAISELRTALTAMMIAEMKLSQLTDRQDAFIAAGEVVTTPESRIIRDIINLIAALEAAYDG